MARPKGSKNEGNSEKSYYLTLTPQERVHFLASLIVDRIIDDQQHGYRLLKQFGEQDDVRPIRV